MPMFEDNMGLVLENDESKGSPQSPDRATTPSKPIAIPTPTINQLSRRLSEESIRTELCDGPVLQSPEQEQPAESPAWDASEPVSDRAELIERLKRGESPTWVPHRRLESLIQLQNSHSPTRSPRPPSAGTPPQSLLPAADITPKKTSDTVDLSTGTSQRLQDGLDIERPRSALHSGDFAHGILEGEQHHTDASREETETALRARGVVGRPFDVESSPWLATSPPRHYHPFTFANKTPPTRAFTEGDAFRTVPSSLSSSLSSSFVHKPPTSPLVQSLSNTDDEDADINLPLDHINITAGSPVSSTWRANTRRYTLGTSSHAQLHHSQSSPYPVLFSPPPPLSGSYRREIAHPYQAHQPRRSLNSTSSFYPQSFATPQTPHSRRLSFASDASPLQHASMVGSYEESILRGRMSTTPSKPLDFLAQVGVLGMGPKCKSSLLCPPQVTIPFSAVFYSYASTPHGRSKMEDGPSPYVGMVDLENGLPSSEADQRANRKRRKSRSRAASKSQLSALRDNANIGFGGAADTEELSIGDAVMKDAAADGSDSDVPRLPTAAAAVPRSHKRRPHTPKAPPGGSYRIPAQGQLQMIIKNQNKTAVKLFLIPYDLTGMEPGTKTFIRQRSYSAGPIIDNIPMLSERASAERPILRYLIHVHICCPSRGRYYLYKSIRVVFANRVPDGKEKLRNELTFPEPRYSPYKPQRAMHPPLSGGNSNGGGPAAMLAAEKAYRRRSAGVCFGSREPGHQLLAGPMPMSIPAPRPTEAWQSSGANRDPSFSFADGNFPVDPMPFGMIRSPAASTASPLTDHPSSDGLDARTAKGVAANAGEHSTGTESAVPLSYEKLNKGDVGYGGNAFVPMVNGSPVVSEGLLSQRLRSL